jgi:STE24 endopeptidase
MSPGQLAEARRYGRIALACTLADRVLDLVFLGLVATLAARPLDDWLAAWRPLHHATARLAAMMLVVTAAHMAVSFPLSLYSGYLLEHRFHLSTLTLAGWLWRYVKRMTLGLALGVPMILGLFWLIWLTGRWWWLTAAGAFFLVSVLLGQLMPVVILPLFYKIVRLDAPELSERFTALAAGTGLTIEGVYRMALSEETVKANAMLAGLGRTRRVLLGDTLLDHFTPDEIEVIFAHEVGHHVFRHIRKIILAGVVTSAAGFWLCDRLLALVMGHGGAIDYAVLPVAALPWIMFMLELFALLVEPLQNTVSRYFERQCDRYALVRTGRREAYCAAFRKLAQLNKDDPDPHWLEIVMLHSHPSIAERLRMGEE